MSPSCNESDYRVVDDVTLMDLARVHRWLSLDAFWARGRTLEQVERAAESSLNFAVMTHGLDQVAYARVVTDHVTFAWLCDVYVDRDHRGRGLGTLLSAAVVEKVRPWGLKRVMLSTLDAHEVYERVGFHALPHPERLMVLD